MRLFVAALLLVATGVAAKIAFEHLAPEGLASASDGLARAETEVAKPDRIDSVELVGPGLRALPLDGLVAPHAGQKLSQADFTADNAAVVSALHASGHLDAAIGPPEVTWSERGADVALPVDPGAVYSVRAVHWRGKQSAAVAKLPVIAAGDTLDEAHLASTASLVEGWLAQRKVRAHVTWAVTVDRAAKLADVTFTVE